MANCGNPSRVTFRDSSTVVAECGDSSSSTGLDCNDCRFTFIAESLALVWVIVHPLNSYPSITVLDENDEVIEAGKKYISPSRIEIHFSTPYKGKVLLN
jgi:hypothetical protein